MRTTLHIDDDIYASVKTLAETNGVPPGTLISQLLRKVLSQTPIGSENSLPVFKVKSNARIIPGNRANKLLSEE